MVLLHLWAAMFNKPCSIWISSVNLELSTKLTSFLHSVCESRNLIFGNWWVTWYAVDLFFFNFFWILADFRGCQVIYLPIWPILLSEDNSCEKSFFLIFIDKPMLGHCTYPPQVSADFCFSEWAHGIFGASVSFQLQFLSESSNGSYLPIVSSFPKIGDWFIFP